ncbi:putative rIIB lysis inhibitor [Achromobacter phage vB_AxyP_19-32_Axy22]|uniref:Putative rIIB lysis inhibitor n=1 Tax=Achromobacter phage vB_AxyP_19-32_Axy22 TaxID=2591046 RepID=A0A514CVV0_9CAUD|nr:putative rIIB lysis inhibitor [Achromobacter phage vB_AxyP_19-32_Axy22]
MQTKMKVKAFVVTTSELTLYSDLGVPYHIRQGDPRVARIVEEIQGPISLGQVVEVVVDGEVTPVVEPTDTRNYFAEAEQQSNGVVRFFRASRRLIRDLFSKKTEPVQEPETAKFVNPTSGGVIPGSQEQEKAKTPEACPVTQANAISEIMANAVPSTAPDFKVPEGVEADQDTGDTVVAVVNGTVIPDAHELAPQIKHAVISNSTLGIQNLMARLSAVARKRGHSVEDLMKFMKLGDLPVTDKGDIVAYKALRRRQLPGYDNRFKYVDIHSGNVPQRVGSFVHMDEKLVDPDRRQDCSNGLHIASRSYLGSFRGDVCVMVLIRPEDVIAVPEYSVNKMRVCGYHIIAELTQSQYNKVLNNQPLTDEESGELLLGRIMSGHHINVTNKVQIGGHRGTKITITEIDKADQTDLSPEVQVAPPSVETAPVAEAPAKTETEKPQEAAKTAPKAPKRRVKAIDTKDPKKPASKAAKLAGKVVSAKDVLTKVKLTQAEEAQKLFKEYANAKTKSAEIAAAKALLNFKKQAKKGWSVLGLPDDTGTELTKVIS